MNDPSSALEEEQRKRWEELNFLGNICEKLPSETEKERLRRSMVLILYSHFEGFTKFALEEYRRAIEESGLRCREINPAIATSSLVDLFKAFRNPEQGASLLPPGLKLAKELKPFAVERAFVEKAWDFGDRIAHVPDDFVDLESNLKPSVLRKNLFRLGLPHDLLDELESEISQLLAFRNKIAHGESVVGIGSHEYEELKEAVRVVVTRIKQVIITSITEQAFRHPKPAEWII